MATSLYNRQPRTLTEQQMLEAEEARINPWTEKPRSERYFELRRQTQALPAVQPGVRGHFLALYHSSQVMVVAGETGSGKSTKIAQFVLYDEHPSHYRAGRIAITQPRRVAARSLAQRVAMEQDVECGKTVGYVYRGEECVDKDHTYMTYCTDGALVARMMNEPDLKGLSTIIIDEAHERTQATDMLLGLLKLLLPQRPDLKVIITSATINADKFQQFFGGPGLVPYMQIPGTPFGVQLLYITRFVPDFVNAAVRAVDSLHRTKPAGDILVFLPGEDEIHVCAEGIRHETRGIDVYELFASMPSEDQQRALHPPSSNQRRRCILATNVAETSLTVDGIVYVVDTGVAKVSFYNPRLRSNKLELVPISKASATQRAGRSGRTQPGVCIRLYTEEMFGRLRDHPIPQIMLGHMGNTILDILAYGHRDVWNFPFLDPPPSENMYRAFEELCDLGCVQVDGNLPHLTPLGHQVRRLPLEPHQAVALARSPGFGCSIEVAQILSVLSVESIIFRPGIWNPYSNQRRNADKAHASLYRPHGDHIMLFHILREFKAEHHRTCQESRNGTVKCSTGIKAHGELMQWCDQRYLHGAELLAAERFDIDLRAYMVRAEIEAAELQDPSSHEASVEIRKALLEGYFLKMAFYSPGQNAYMTTAENQSGQVNPDSPLAFDSENEYPVIMYDDFSLVGNRQYFMGASGIESRWIFLSERARAYAEELVVKDNERKAPKGKPKAAPKLPIQRLIAAQAAFQRDGPSHGNAS